MKLPIENTLAAGPHTEASPQDESAELLSQLWQAQAKLAQTEKVLFLTQHRLQSAEQATRAAQTELTVIRQTRFWKIRTRLLRLKQRLQKHTPVEDVQTPEPTRHPAFSGIAQGVRPQNTEPGRTILVIDSYLPIHDQEAGALRLLYVLKMMRALNYSVLFFPHDGLRREPYTQELQELGIEILDNRGEVGDPEERLRDWLPWVDIAWISRPEHYDNYAPVLWQNSAIKVIYDTVDLHFVRMKRQWELTSDRSEADKCAWEAMRTRELRAARLADLTLVVTDVERRMLNDLGVNGVGVIPTIHEAEKNGFKEFKDRAGLLFIGGPHTPNIDAVQWLCREVMPLVWRERPDITVTLLGSKPAPEVLALASERISVPGFIRDVSPHFQQSRIFVAPLRFGAGMKGKVGQSLGYGLPCVLTPVAAEGIGLTDGVNALIVDTAAAFAAAILRLYGDEALWNSLSQNSFEAVRPFGTEAVQQNLEVLLNSLSDAEAVHV